MLSLNLIGGWLGILAGVIAGAIMGLYFHQDGWLGGYASYPRRLMRLGHVAFFGLGFLNLLFVATAHQLALPAPYLWVASRALMAGAVTMPICCMLSAWYKPLRHLFPIPVTFVVIGLVAIVIGGWHP